MVWCYNMIILETNKLILRTWIDGDLEPLTAINADPKVCEYLPSIGTRATTIAMMQRFINHYDEHGFSAYAVELKATHEMIGFTGLITPSFDADFMPAIEVGWRLASTHWNKGYATEAALAALNYGFVELSLNEIVSFTVVKNNASRRVMEKIGLHHNPNDDFDHPKLEDDSPLKRHVFYRLTKNDYLKNLGSKI